jgi:hypothetical protein
MLRFRRRKSSLLLVFVQTLFTRNGPTQRLLQGSSPTDSETHLVNWRSFEDTCKYVRFVMMYEIANEYVAVKNST